MKRIFALALVFVAVVVVIGASHPTAVTTATHGSEVAIPAF